MQNKTTKHETNNWKPGRQIKLRHQTITPMKKHIKQKPRPTDEHMENKYKQTKQNMKTRKQIEKLTTKNNKGNALKTQEKQPRETKHEIIEATPKQSD